MTVIAPRVLFASLIAAALITVAGDALARPEMAGQSAASRFAAMDADKDGSVSREEFFAAQPQMKDAAFDAIDADKSGSISLEEWEGFAMGHGSSQSGGMPPKGDGAPGMTMPPQGESKAAPELIMPPVKQ